jgi:hypothetical protein
MKWLAAVLLVAACNKDHDKCEKFVDLAFQCKDELKATKGDERKTAQLMMGGMCEEAYRNNTSSVKGEARKLVTEMYEEMRKRADCAANANSCSEYNVCAPDDNLD